jgi:hypothetical protein
MSSMRQQALDAADRSILLYKELGFQPVLVGDAERTKSPVGFPPKAMLGPPQYQSKFKFLRVWNFNKSHTVRY